MCFNDILDIAQCDLGSINTYSTNPKCLSDSFSTYLKFFIMSSSYTDLGQLIASLHFERVPRQKIWWPCAGSSQYSLIFLFYERWRLVDQVTNQHHAWWFVSMTKQKFKFCFFEVKNWFTVSTSSQQRFYHCCQVSRPSLSSISN